MKKWIVFFALLSGNLINSQAQSAEGKRTFLTGLSVEAGAGYGILVHRMSVLGTKEEYIRMAPWVQPTFRISYNIPVLKSSPDRVFITPFIGYFTCGGRSDVSYGGYKDEFVFRAAELGVMIPVFLLNNVSFSPAFKAQYIFDAEQRYYGALYQDDSIPRTWNIERSVFFKNYSVSSGLNIKYHIKKVTIAVEAWVGLTNLNAVSAYVGNINWVRIKEHNARFMIGYIF